ncbi:MAG: Hsp20/alpha crystallin family protein [Acidobacteriota bacterium]
MTDWDDPTWNQAQGLLRQAERIRATLLEAAAVARSEIGGQAVWGPAVNVYETERALWIVVALPGVSSESIEVATRGEWILIRGHRTMRARLPDGQCRLLEIPAGPFERKLRFPGLGEIQIGGSELKDGLLWIEVRK